MVRIQCFPFQFIVLCLSSEWTRLIDIKHARFSPQCSEYELWLLILTQTFIVKLCWFLSWLLILGTGIVLILCSISLSLCMSAFMETVWVQPCKRATVFNEAFTVVRERKEGKCIERRMGISSRVKENRGYTLLQREGWNKIPRKTSMGLVMESQWRLK